MEVVDRPETVEVRKFEKFPCVVDFFVGKRIRHPDQVMKQWDWSVDNDGGKEFVEDEVDKFPINDFKPRLDFGEEALTSCLDSGTHSREDFRQRLEFN